MFSLASLRSDWWTTCPELVDDFVGIHSIEKHISESLGKASRDRECPESHIEKQALVNSTVQHIRWHKEQWSNVDEAIQTRERERRSLG